MNCSVHKITFNLVLGIIVLLLLISEGSAIDLFSNRNLSPEEPSIIQIEVGSPSGNTIRPLLGVDSGPRPYGDAGNSDLTDNYHSIGVNEVRTHGFVNAFSMSDIYFDRSKDPLIRTSYNFTNTDYYAEGIINGGFGMYLRIGDSYEHINPPLPSEQDNWTRAVIEVVRHYYQGKWNGYHANITYIEIWNEPDNRHFWPKPHTNEEFFQLFKKVMVALKNEFPKLKIGGPGFSPAGFKSENGKEFVNDFVDFLKKENLSPDFVSYHVYSNNPFDNFEAARYYRDILDSSGNTGTEIHLTEYNTEVKRGPQTKESLALRAGMPGAMIMTETWMVLQDTPVTRAFLFRGNDPTIFFPSFYGIFYANGTSKRIAEAFGLWNKISSYGERLNIKIKNVSGKDTVAAIAGIKPDGSIGVLTTHKGKTPSNIIIKGLTKDMRGTWKRTELTENGLMNYTMKEGVFSLKPGSINLIEYTPQGVP